MSHKHYNYDNGPDVIQPHSIAKHDVLRSYLAAYFQTLVSGPQQDVMRVTLVDGFAGGALYFHSETKHIVEGSPLILLKAAEEAEFLINQGRNKPIKMEVDHFFIEAKKSTFQHLEKTLKEKGYGSRIGQSIHLFHSKFQDKAESVISFINKKSPRNGRSIFILDQYGYKDVPTALIRKIFQSLPSAEVILTFGVDSFLNYANDGELTKSLLEVVGVPDIFQGRSIEQIKSSERDWRLFIQSSLYKGLVSKCGAKHSTPFFIRNNKGHGDYWLIHLSQHYRARDVMTEVHWKNNNYFIHYGGSGLDMFQMNGYDPDRDLARFGQSALGFEFDDPAKAASVSALNEQIPRLVYANDSGISFGELYVATCNDSPASAAIYRDSIGQLIGEKALEVVSVDGVSRRSGQQIKQTDQIMAPRQRGLFFI